MTIDWDGLLLAPVHALLGEAVVWLPGDGRSVSMTGVFTEKYTVAHLQDEMQVAGSVPILNVRDSLFARLPTQGELFRVRGVLFQVIGTEPDGLGDVKIVLRAASDTEAAKGTRP